MKMQPDDPTPEQEAMRELHGEILGLREQLRDAVRLIHTLGKIHGYVEIHEYLDQHADIVKEIEAGN